jgi:predicted aconitase
MTTRWKDNFNNFAMELLFSTYSVLEVEEKLVEDEPVVRDNMEGGEDEMRTFGAKLAAKGGH